MNQDSKFGGINNQRSKMAYMERKNIYEIGRSEQSKIRISPINKRTPKITAIIVNVREFFNILKTENSFKIENIGIDKKIIISSVAINIFNMREINVLSLIVIFFMVVFSFQIKNTSNSTVLIVSCKFCCGNRGCQIRHPVGELWII